MAIHPMLPALVAASLAGLLVPDRQWRRTAGGSPAPLRRPAPAGVAWAALGLAATALLAPALTIPGGVPSPAALLTQHPPWQEALAPPTAAAGSAGGAAAAEAVPVGDRITAADGHGFGNPVLSDVVYQIEPWLIHLRRELRAGRAPFWNPYQYAGAPFWSNGQSAPLFPLHLLFAALPLGAGLVLLPWLKVMIAGLGARALARELGVSEGAAVLAGLSFALSGMLAGFVLYPMGNALALVPWVLWAVERLAAGRSGPLPLALASGLQLLAGHPETALHTVLLSGIYLLVRGVSVPTRAEGPAGGPLSLRVAAGQQTVRGAPEAAAWLQRRAVWGGWAAGWVLGAALAAVQLVPLAFDLAASARWQAVGGGFAEPLGRLLVQPLRLVLPELYGDPARGTWFGPYNYLATAVYAGALALPLAAVGLGGIRKRAPVSADGAGGSASDSGSSTGPSRPPAAEAERGALGTASSTMDAGTDDGPGSSPGSGLGSSRPSPDESERAVREAAFPGVIPSVPLTGSPPSAGRDRGLAGGMPAARWDRRWLAVAALLAFSFAAAYHLPGIRQGLEALPLIGRAAHHRLIFGVELALALLAAAGFDRWRAGRGGRALAAGGALVALLIVVAWWRLGGEWAARGLTARQLAWSAGAAAAVALLIAGRRLAPRPRWALALALPALAAVDLLVAHGAINPGLPLDRLFPETPAVRFLQERPGRVAGAGTALRPNAAMVYRLHDVRGDDTVKSARWTRFETERLGAGHPNYFTPIRRWDPLWLDRLGVRWVMTAPGVPPPVEGWRLAFDGADARVWERPGVLAPARWTGAAEPGRRVEVLERASGRWLLRWSSPRRGVLVVAEAFDPGWSARTVGVAGGRVPVHAAGDVLIGLELGPGEGEVELVYRPRGLVWGAAASMVGVLALVGSAWRRRRPAERP